MWRKKKFIISIIMATVLLAAGIGGGIALAADNEEDESTSIKIIREKCNTDIWEKMAEVLQADGIVITSDQLQAAFSEAKEKAREDALQNFLDEQVAEGNITREQADAYREWLDTRPDIGNACREWMESKPDMGDEFKHPGLAGNRIEFRGPNNSFIFETAPGNMHGFGGMRFGKYFPAP